MKRFVLLLLLLSLTHLHAQEFEIVRHQVQMGETVKMLSKKYKVEPSEIYRLNKFAIDGIRQGMILQIMVPKQEIALTEVSENITEEIVEPAASEVNHEIAQSENNQSMAQSSETELEISHTVAKGETLYSLSRKYNVPVDQIKSQNEQILKKGLQTGQVLTIRSNNQ